MRDRDYDKIRPVEITPHFQKKPYGSVLYKQGETVVLCSAQVMEGVPDWINEQNCGWLTAEYSMLPGSTETRVSRQRYHINGRSKEIERLIGRALRASIELEKIGQRTIWIDCDVLQADGGTRTASITAGFLALYIATRRLIREGKIVEDPIRFQVAAISAGIVDGIPMLDLNYEEDSKADVDLNVAMTSDLRYVEIQGTSEHKPLSDKNLQILLQYAKKGIKELLEKQKEVMDNV